MALRSELSELLAGFEKRMKFCDACWITNIPIIFVK